jgi:hypothetical protein
MQPVSDPRASSARVAFAAEARSGGAGWSDTSGLLIAGIDPCHRAVTVDITSPHEVLKVPAVDRAARASRGSHNGLGPALSQVSTSTERR